MLLLETSAELTNPRYSRVPMDARTVARVAGIKLNTLNAWISRGMVSWVTVGTSGKRRDFDFNTALRIAIFAGLIKHLAPPEYAARAAESLSETRIQAGWVCVIPAQVEGRLTIAHFSPDEQSELIDLIRLWGDSQEAPTYFDAINVGKLAARVRQAEAEWLARQQDKQPDG